jgi:hypothetical protein
MGMLIRGQQCWSFYADLQSTDYQQSTEDRSEDAFQLRTAMLTPATINETPIQ